MPERILRIASAIRNNVSIDEVARITGWDKWFLSQISGIIKIEEKLIKNDAFLNQASLCPYCSRM